LAAVITIVVVSPTLCAENKITVARVTISLVREAEIPTRDAGVLAQLPVKEGQAVEAGRILAVLENGQQELALSAAELNLQVAAMDAENDLPLKTAAAQLQEAMSGRTVKEVSLKIAEAGAKTDIGVQVAVAGARLKQLELDRAEKARKSFQGSISESQLDRLKTSLEQGNLEVTQATTEYEIQKLKQQGEQAELQQQDEQIKRYQSLMEQERRQRQVAAVSEQLRKNEVQVARLKLEQRNIRAPFSGTIASIDRHVGEWVEPGMTVMRVIDLNTLQAEGFLTGQQASQSLTGRPVRIQFTATDVPPVTGRVTFVSSEVDPVNQRVRFRAEFDNSRLTVRPGMTASLTIE